MFILLAGVPGAILCTLGCVLPSFIICLALAFFYYKYRSFDGVQTVLASLRPVVVALIGSARISILTLALFSGEGSAIEWSNLHLIEFALFIGGLYLLRKYKAHSIAIIFGSGVVGTAAYFALGLI